MEDMILTVKNLDAGYLVKKRKLLAVRNVSFNLRRGEFLGIAGESGCGKSTLAYAIMGLLEDNGRIFYGEIGFDGKNLGELGEREMKKIRWARISMVFQSAMNALNPVLTIREQLLDTILSHRPDMDREAAQERAVEMLRLVDITEDRLTSYPHQMSGGMKQRVMIAMALLLEPDIIIMDEPTTALDVVVQRTIIDKISDLRKKFGFSVIFITHDLSLLVEISDRLMIMYGGEVVEYGEAEEVYRNPGHHYTRGLMDSFPPLTGEMRDYGGIPGKPPNLLDPPEGCLFAPRCPRAAETCRTDRPPLTEGEAGHYARCFFPVGRS